MKKIILRSIIFSALLLSTQLSWAGHVYLNQEAAAAGDGKSAATAYKSWNNAITDMKTQQHDSGDCIVMCSSYGLGSTNVIDGLKEDGTKIKIIRNDGMTEPLITLYGTWTSESSNNLVDGLSYVSLNNIILSGEFVSPGYSPSTTVKPIISAEYLKKDDAHKPYGKLILGSGCELRNNTSHNGAAVFLKNYVLEIKDGAVIDNCHSVGTYSDGQGRGGAIYVTGFATISDVVIKGSVTMTGGSISNCSALSGGAIYLEDTEMELSGGSISNCSATQYYAGAIYVSGFVKGDSDSKYQGKIIMSGGTISNCSSISRGGALFLHDSEMTLSGGCIEGCTSNSGGAIEMYVYRNFKDTGLSEYVTTFTMTGGVITKCKSIVTGGGIDGYHENSYQGGHMKMTLSGGEISYCSSFDPSEYTNGRGGGINVFCMDCVVKGNIKIHHNFCKMYGGAIQVTTDGSLDIQGGEIYRNCAQNSIPYPNGNEDAPVQATTSETSGGGAFHITGGSYFSIEGGKIHDNFTSGVGGAIHTSYKGTIEITGGSFTNNIALVKGGAINANTSTNIDISGTDTEIKNNESGCGGAFMIDGATVTIQSGNISGNKARRMYEGQGEYGIGGFLCLTMEEIGGQISPQPAKAIINGGTITDNDASLSGGAVYIKKRAIDYVCEGASEIQMSDGLLRNNKALLGDGGAFYINEGNLTVSGGNIQNNQAPEGKGGAFYISEGNVNLASATAISNISGSDGGVLYVKTGSVQVADDFKFDNNTSTNGNGGAFCVTGGDVTVTNGIISNNHAPNGNGGGAYVAGGTVTFSGNLKGNTAMNGGGLYLASQATMTFKGGIISGNSAVVRSASGIASTAYNSGNETGYVEGCGGGIYLASGDEGHMTSLNFDLSGSSFGLYSNLADKGGDDLVSEGIFTSIVLPDVSSLSLAGFEGKDANPDWYEDYFTEDTSYKKGTFVRDVSKKRYRDLLGEASDEFSYHRIPLTGQTAPETIANKYLCLTLGYQSLKFTLKVTGLVGEECAKFLLRRHGAEGNNTDYDLLFSADDDAENPGTSTKVFANMAWGDYSILPVEGWNWAYDPVTPVVNIHIANTWEYEHTFEMKHRNNSQIPLHEEHNVAL